ncbi:MAG: SprT-like domain-containing protein [Campylobacterota bacterium]
MKNLQKLFLFITTISIVLLIYLWYKDYSFENKSLDSKYINMIKQKEASLKRLAYINFNVTRDIPIIVSDRMKASRFGMAVYSKDSSIKIYLNKNRFKESASYMINDVLPHEYAHALMFIFKDFTKQNSGHTKRWQNICKKLNGLRCSRFVNNKDILIEKTNIFK